jgi:hypothetical protein
MTNICRNYFLPCPYALSGDDSQLPCCVPDQKSCDKYTQKYKTEAPEDFKKLQGIKKELGRSVHYMDQQDLLEKIVYEFNK